ncbi:MAG TPA: asparaginase [Chloroflexota bacterium]
MSVTEQISTREAAQEEFSGDVPLVADMRGGYLGSLHRGSVAVSDSAGRVILAAGDPQQRAFLRSAAKPFQVIPAILSGALERFRVTERELAVLCASHNAEPMHIDAVLTVLGKIGLSESALHCGAHPPLSQSAAVDRWRHGIDPTPVCNNCSGAHAGMLLACVARGWPLKSYGDLEHPLQRQTRQILASFADIDPAQIETAVDNCAVPTFRLPLDHAAQAFARLGNGDGMSTDLQRAAERVRNAMVRYPEMVAGENRFDTDLMRADGGSLVAKGGAEGFQGVGVLSSGLGIALKISDGASSAVGPATVRVLEGLDVLDEEALSSLESYREPLVHNMRGEVVGRVQPVFEVQQPA